MSGERINAAAIIQSRVSLRRDLRSKNVEPTEGASNGIKIETKKKKKTHDIEE